ncbi:uncharacterized protein BO72DRAFT_495262 [Aspergillus fijiensis CBS 313.89]|uniref:Uncharacterized protein n=1 Tax=Aspergillus fijiensis CBS 313.89 TaxID=1448319 RepID=A0A8G1VZP9_9EURO|nr:uncharacterized protein BO72DRAFT_495262 [Aspergillus fijiensis CBS 313.89]RAK78527.1 hypothetical protein BO72DRAFT_495262 [Aspergillus fijiensis CBS 313.89]
MSPLTPRQIERSERFRQAGMFWHRTEMGDEQVTVPVSFLNFIITANKDSDLAQRRYFVAAREVLRRRFLALITAGYELPMPVLRIYQPPPFNSSSESDSDSEGSESESDDYEEMEEEMEEEEEEEEEGYAACDEKSVEGSSVHDDVDSEDDDFDVLSDFTVKMEFVVAVTTVHEPADVLENLVAGIEEIIAEIDSTGRYSYAAARGLVSARIVKDGLPMQEEEEEVDSEWTDDEESFDEAEECCPSEPERFGDDRNDPESAGENEDEENPIIYSDDDVVPLDVDEDAVLARIAWLLQDALKSNP